MDVVLPYGPTSVSLTFPRDVVVEIVPTKKRTDLVWDGDANRLALPTAEDAVVDAALDAPVASPRLEALAAGRRRVTVVVPDGTRPARLPLVLARVLDRLARSGVAPRAVSVLVGGGLHAPPDERERFALFGACAAPVTVTTPDDPTAYEALPDDRELGRPALHRLVTRADLVVVVGAVAPHYLAGCSGGAKGLVVGCGDRATVQAAHRITLDATVGPDGSVRAWLGRPEGNPFRTALVRVARTLPAPVFLLNVGLVGGRVAVAAAGDVDAAHAAAWEALRARAGASRPDRADLVVVAPGAGRDGDLVQAHKALVPAEEVARPGAPFVWLAHAARGPGHPHFLPWFETGPLRRHLLALRRNFEPYGLTAYALRWKATRHPIYVASTMPADALRPLGLFPLGDPQTALDAALARTREARAATGDAGPRVVVLPIASETFWR